MVLLWPNIWRIHTCPSESLQRQGITLIPKTDEEKTSKRKRTEQQPSWPWAHAGQRGLWAASGRSATGSQPWGWSVGPASSLWRSRRGWASLEGSMPYTLSPVTAGRKRHCDTCTTVHRAQLEACAWSRRSKALCAATKTRRSQIKKPNLT